MSKSIADLVPSKVSGRLAKFHRLVEEDGLSWEAFQWPIDDSEMRKRLVRFWVSGCYQPTTSQSLSREIMGQNFFGTEEAIQYFGIKPEEKDNQALAEVPFNEASLRKCKDTHILVAVFPLSILEIRQIVERKLFYSHEDAWYNNQLFAQERGEAGWHLIRKDIVPNSTNKNWQEQQALLDENEETPSARVAVYTIIGHYENTEKRLFEKICIRCQCLSSAVRRVFVGYFGAFGLSVSDYLDGERHDSLGLASSLKIQSS